MSIPEWQQRLPGDKVATTQEALVPISNGCHVFIGTGCGEPQHLIHAMVVDKGTGINMIYQMLSHTLVPYLDDPSFGSRFLLKLFFISASIPSLLPTPGSLLLSKRSSPTSRGL
ncbi:MAG: hypothetical protein KJO60_09680 [Desulfofustis sp.]|nr:hypothetical protein [Desulfofustis sp.]NNK57123.1 hypothetical protein [Desulfofustis sp.]